MSREYDLYLTEHKAGVLNAFRWIEDHIPEVLAEINTDITWQIQFGHDASKSTREEYAAYDQYFYGDPKYRSSKVINNFNYAWLHHIHNNPHHWQYWVLVNDDKELGSIALEMPVEYVIEMICDWWSFSFRAGNLYEIFEWYDNHKDYMILHKNTKKFVETILAKIKNDLDAEQKKIEEEVKRNESRTS